MSNAIQGGAWGVIVIGLIMAPWISGSTSERPLYLIAAAVALVASAIAARPTKKDTADE